jgi:hypothetical protein
MSVFELRTNVSCDNFIHNYMFSDNPTVYSIYLALFIQLKCIAYILSYSITNDRHWKDMHTISRLTGFHENSTMLYCGKWQINEIWIVPTLISNCRKTKMQSERKLYWQSSKQITLHTYLKCISRMTSLPFPK